MQGEGRGLAVAEGTQATAENDGGAAGQHPRGKYRRPSRFCPRALRSLALLAALWKGSD